MITMALVSRTIRTFTTVVFGSVFFLFTGHWAVAAEDSIQAQLDAARSIMQQLDELAAACVNPNQQATATPETPCLNFSNALNGEMLASYISHCRSIKTWRDEFVSSQSANQTNTDTDTSLSLMIDSEFLCGDDALTKRTDYIGIAYQQINGTNRSDPANVAATNTELQALRQQMLISRERQRLMNSFQQQQQRQRLETQRQFDRQELELIRQQTVPLNQRR